MSVIRIDTGQVQSTGQQFHSKSGELSGLHQQAKSLMASLQGQFMGQRASAVFADWEAMQPSLLNAVETLQISGDLLKRAATEFSAVDSSR